MAPKQDFLEDAKRRAENAWRPKNIFERTPLQSLLGPATNFKHL